MCTSVCPPALQVGTGPGDPVVCTAPHEGAPFVPRTHHAARPGGLRRGRRSAGAARRFGRRDDDCPAAHLAARRAHRDQPLGIRCDPARRALRAGRHCGRDVPHGAASHDTLSLGAQRGVFTADSAAGQRGRGHPCVRQLRGAGQLRRGRRRLPHPHGDPVRGHREGGRARGGGRGPLRARRHARQADGHRRRAAGGDHRRGRGEEAQADSSRARASSTGRWMAR